MKSKTSKSGTGTSLVIWHAEVTNNVTDSGVVLAPLERKRGRTLRMVVHSESLRPWSKHANSEMRYVGIIAILLYVSLADASEKRPAGHSENAGAKSSTRFSTDVPPANPAHWARRVYATLYQSCDVLRMEANRFTPIEDVVSKDSDGDRYLVGESARQRYIDRHFILKNLKNKNPDDGCVDILKHPPIYVLSAKPIFASGQIDLQADRTPLHNVPTHDIDAGFCDTNPRLAAKSDSVAGLDCSGFIAAAFARGGLKFFGNQVNPGLGICSDWIHSAKNRPGSCLDDVALSESTGEGLRVGDLINSARHHVVMIDRVGKDPFGIQRAVAEDRDCSTLTTKDFDFSILHSSSMGSWGVFRAHIDIYSQAKDSDGTTKLIARQLETTAQNLCRTAKTGGKGLRTSSPIHKNFPFSILRHRSSDPTCSFPEEKRVPLRNERCVDHCFLSKPPDFR